MLLVYSTPHINIEHYILYINAEYAYKHTHKSAEYQQKATHQHKQKSKIKTNEIAVS